MKSNHNPIDYALQCLEIPPEIIQLCKDDVVGGILIMTILLALITIFIYFGFGI
jgi:hypothetical protein